MEPVNEEDTISALMQPHNQFVGSLQSRLAKLEVISPYHYCYKSYSRT